MSGKVIKSSDSMGPQYSQYSRTCAACTQMQVCERPRVHTRAFLGCRFVNEQQDRLLAKLQRQQAASAFVQLVEPAWPARPTCASV